MVWLTLLISPSPLLVLDGFFSHFLATWALLGQLRGLAFLSFSWQSLPVSVEQLDPLEPPLSPACDGSLACVRGWSCYSARHSFGLPLISQTRPARSSLVSPWGVYNLANLQCNALYCSRKIYFRYVMNILLSSL